MITKYSSYGPEQDSLPPSPGPPKKGWGKGSYDARGRAREQSSDGYGGNNAELGGGHCTSDHTHAGYPSKPGRW